MPLLKKGRLVVSPATRVCYKVTSERVARGGFGEVFRGIELDAHRDARRDVAIKVCMDARVWHGEAYFNHLLDEQPHVVRLYDAFPIVDGAGAAQQVKYLLIFEWMDGGTVEDFLAADSSPWRERAVVREIKKLLKVLAPLHERGICHADITPRNVFLDGKRLRLGDLGIAKQSLGNGRMRLHGAAPRIFTPRDVVPFQWSASEDVYQVGLIALSLLSGEVITSQHVRGRALRSVCASDSFKGWIRESLLPRPNRFRDAEHALECLGAKPVKAARSPRTLRGQYLVFTGTLPMRRDAAKRRAKRAGATVQRRVNGQTTLVVSGHPNSQMIGERRGTKLFDANRRIRDRQRIAIIDAKRFLKLLAE